MDIARSMMMLLLLLWLDDDNIVMGRDESMSSLKSSLGQTQTTTLQLLL